MSSYFSRALSFWKGSHRTLVLVWKRRLRYKRKKSKVTRYKGQLTIVLSVSLIKTYNRPFTDISVDIEMSVSLKTTFSPELLTSHNS